MANKQIKKVPIDKDNFMRILNDKGLSIRALGRDKNFNWSEKSIGRGLKDGQISEQLLNDLLTYLNVTSDEIISHKKEVSKYKNVDMDYLRRLNDAVCSMKQSIDSDAGKEVLSDNLDSIKNLVDLIILM